MLFLLMGTLASFSITEGDTIITHSGAQDPIYEGWFQVLTGSDIITYDLLNDGNTGIDAWVIDDNSTSTSDALICRCELRRAEQEALNEQGWTVRVKIKVADFPTELGSAFLKMQPGIGGAEFQLGFGSDTNDDLDCIIVSIDGSPIYHETIGYDIVEVQWTPTSSDNGELTMSINGTTRYHTHIGMYGSGSPYIEWGAQGSAAVAQVNWNLITVDSVADIPAPTGDVNNDQRVDLLDLRLVAKAWLARPGDDAWNKECDLAAPRNMVDVNDLLIVAEDWLEEEPDAKALF